MSSLAHLQPWTVAPARLLEVTEETPGVHTYQIELTCVGDRTAYAAQPGQFNMLYLPGVGEAAISLSRLTPLGGPLIHTVRGVGNVTRGLAKLTTGDSLGIRGPFGTAWPIDQAIGKDLIVVAGGIGLAPLRPVVDHIRKRRGDFGRVELLMGATTPAALLYADQYHHWRRDEINVWTTVDRPSEGWIGKTGLVTSLLNQIKVTSPQQPVVFSCGPEIMMTSVIEVMRRRGVADHNQWVSLERNMNCGFGHCGHCQLGPFFVCVDGPVFRYDQVAKWMKVNSL